MANVKESMDVLLQSDGAMCTAIVDANSGMVLGQSGTGLDLELAAAGNTEVVRAKLKTMKSLGLNDKIEDILITLGTQLFVRWLRKKACLSIWCWTKANRIWPWLAVTVRKWNPRCRCNLLSPRHAFWLAGLFLIPLFLFPFPFSLLLPGNLLCLSVGLLLVVSPGALFYHLLYVWGDGMMLLEKSFRNGGIKACRLNKVECFRVSIHQCCQAGQA